MPTKECRCTSLMALQVSIAYHVYPYTICIRCDTDQHRSHSWQALWWDLSIPTSTPWTVLVYRWLLSAIMLEKLYTFVFGRSITTCSYDMCSYDMCSSFIPLYTDDDDLLLLRTECYWLIWYWRTTTYTIMFHNSTVVYANKVSYKVSKYEKCIRWQSLSKSVSCIG